MPHSGAPLGRVRILLVEDSELDAELLIEQLLDAGLENAMQQRFRHYGARLVGRFLSQRQLGLHDGSLMPYLIDSIAATALAFLMRWLREDLLQPAEQLAAFYDAVTRPGLLAVLAPQA